MTAEARSWLKVMKRESRMCRRSGRSLASLIAIVPFLYSFVLLHTFIVFFRMSMTLHSIIGHDVSTPQLPNVVTNRPSGASNSNACCRPRCSLAAIIRTPRFRHCKLKSMLP